MIPSICAVVSAHGQQPTETAAPQQQPAQTADANRTARDANGQTSRVFEIKHRSPEQMLPVLRPLGSNIAIFTTSREFKTITVRDYEENLRQIEQAIRRLDLPEAVGRDIELRFHVLLASNTEAAQNDRATRRPAELEKAVKQLQATLNYKTYEFVSTLIQRTKEGERGVSGSGSFLYTAPGLNPMNSTGTLNFTYQTGAVGLQTSQNNLPVVRFSDFQFRGSSRLGEPSVKTEVSLREGEQVVVGTAVFGDNALILVISVRILQ